MSRRLLGLIVVLVVLAVEATGWAQTNLTVVRHTDNTIWAMTCQGTTDCSAWTQIAGGFSTQPTLTWDPSIQKYLCTGIGNNGSNVWRTTFNADGTWNNDWVLIGSGASGSPSPVASSGGGFKQPPSRVYRWNVFNTYYEGYGWFFNNDGSLLGGVTPNTWTDGNGKASQISSDKEVQRTLFVNRAYPGNSAMVYAQRFYNYSSTDGRVVVVLFRVRNKTAQSVTWPMSLRYTCNGNWNEYASVALNGVDVYVDPGSTYGNVTANVNLHIPASRTSTVIVVSTSGPVGGGNIRATLLAFVDGSLALPIGLEFVDDLDTATGGYEQ